MRILPFPSFSKYLKSIGYYSAVVNTEYTGDELELSTVEDQQTES